MLSESEANRLIEMERRIDAGETWKGTPKGTGEFQIGRIDPGGAVTHKGPLPYSRTLPPTEEKGEIVNRSGHTVRRLKCGAYATMEGRRIIDSKEAGDRHASDAGFVRVK